MAEANKTVNVRIQGRVQGVCFRYWTSGEAAARGLGGWVMNRPDGSVEALFSGPAQKADDMVEACWKGPPSARVVAVMVSPAEPPGGAGLRVVGWM